MKFKKLITGITVFALVLTVAATLIISALSLPTETQQANVDTSDDYEYAIYNGTIKITGYNGNDTVLVIPSEIDGKKVTGIRWDAFQCRESLTSITIPDSVTSIDGYTFRKCSSLTSITIPNSVTSMGYGAFDGTPWLDAQREKNPLVVVNGILIDGQTAEGDIIIPNSVTSIGDWAFSQCKNITNITIPDSVTSIGDRAFSGCSSLTSITIPKRVEHIGYCAFSHCTSLTSTNVSKGNKNYCSVDGVLFNMARTEIVCYPAEKSDKSYTIPDSVTSIEGCAFSGCSNLTSVTIPGSVKNIGYSAFSGCSSLTSIIIPKRVEYIEEGAFSCCSSLKRITIPYSVTIIEGWAFYGCESLTDVYYTGTEKQWKLITALEKNSAFFAANRHYNYNPYAPTGLKLK